MEPTREEMLNRILVMERGTGRVVSLAQIEKETGCEVPATDEELMKVYSKIKGAMDQIIHDILFGPPIQVNEGTPEGYCEATEPPAKPNPVYVPKHIQRRERWKYDKR